MKRGLAPVLKLFPVAHLILAILAFGACSNSFQANPGSPFLTDTTGSIPFGGGTLTLSGMGSIDVPKGALPVDQSVTLSLISSGVGGTFGDSAALTGDLARSTKALRIHYAGPGVPVNPIVVRLTIADTVLTRWPAGAIPVVYAKVIAAGGMETVDQFVPLPSDYDGSTHTVTAKLPHWVFAPSRSGPAEFEAIVVVGAWITATPTSAESQPAGTKIGNGADECTVTKLLSPLDGPQPGRALDQEFNGPGIAGLHWGIDYPVDAGTTVYAARAGTVEAAKLNQESYGNFIVIRHPDGARTLYAHLSALSTSTSSQVAQGAPIGISGNTGRSDGPHLHFEYGGFDIADDPTDPKKVVTGRVDPTSCFIQSAIVTVTPPTATLTVGDPPLQLSVTARSRYQGGEPPPGPVTWASDGPAATVSQSGVVTAVAPGSVNITARYAGGEFGVAAITVVASTVVSITVSPPQATLLPGQSQQFTATALDEDGDPISGATFTWTSSDPAVALNSAIGTSVTATASPAALGGGAATITASTRGKQGIATVTVRSLIARIVVSPPQVTVQPSESQAFTAKALDAQGTTLSGVSFTWTSSDAAVSLSTTTGASVTATVAEGAEGGTTATITVTSGTKEGIAHLTVFPAPTLAGRWHLTSYRTLDLPAVCGEGCDKAEGPPSFRVDSGLAVLTAATSSITIWGTLPDASHHFPPDAPAIMLFSSAGHYEYSFTTSTPTNYPQVPECNAIGLFSVNGQPAGYCTIMPPGPLFIFTVGSTTLPGAVLVSPTEMVSAFGGQTVWER